MKNEMEGRRDIKGGKEGVEQESRKEWKKVLKERKDNKNNNNKELLYQKERKKKKTKPGAFKLAKPVLLVFWLQPTQGA